MRAWSVSLLALLLLSGAECEQARLAGLDKGRMIIDGADGPVEACPYELPWRVAGEPYFVDLLCNWGPDWFIPALGEERAYDVGVVWVEEGMPWEEDALAEADVGWNRWGQILYCVITVGPLAPDVDVLHEGGHCLGLDDDPPSIDLNSIMSSPTVEGSELTSGDRQLLEEGC